MCMVYCDPESRFRINIVNRSEKARQLVVDSHTGFGRLRILNSKEELWKKELRQGVVLGSGDRIRDSASL